MRIRMMTVRRVVAIVVAMAMSCAMAHAADPATQRSPQAWADPAMPVKNGVVLWLDVARQPAARKATGKPKLADGAAVDVLFDASPSARHFAQPDASAQPHFFDDSIRFDGKNDHLTNAGAADASLK